MNSVCFGDRCAKQRDPRILRTRTGGNILRRHHGLGRAAGHVDRQLSGPTHARRRPYAEFAVSAAGAFLGLPFLLAFLFVPFPYAWLMLFLAVFGLFLNMGPVNAILANVTPPAVRSTAFALNLFLLHALGDVISPPIIGIMTDRFDWTTAYLMVIGMIVISGALWSWGCLYLERDTRRAPLLLALGSETSYITMPRFCSTLTDKVFRVRCMKLRSVSDRSLPQKTQQVKCRKQPWPRDRPLRRHPTRRNERERNDDAKDSLSALRTADCRSSKCQQR